MVMKHRKNVSALVTAFSLVGLAIAADPALTIYNGGFGVVRERLSLDLEQGENEVSFSEATAHLEPQSVVLRDLSGETELAILEQSYRADPISQGLLLNYFEGEKIEFQQNIEDGSIKHVTGRIIRSGYQPHTEAMNRYGPQYTQRQNSLAYSGASQPVIEVDGQIRFGLPGLPLFPALPDDSILKPTLDWTLHSSANATVDAEISYITQGMSWQADYNVVARDDSDQVEVVGWITMDNQTGKSFDQAKIKLIAGDVRKIAPGGEEIFTLSPFEVAADARQQQVEEKSFEDFHMYTLPRPTTLLDRQTKQVEFLRGENVTAKTLYVYDGAAINPNRYRGWDPVALRQEQSFGTESHDDVWIMREIDNTEANNLGVALPKGSTRFYKQDEDGQLEFTGEAVIDHTPRNETIKLYTGNAFDLLGERTRTDFQIDRHRYADESFEITLTNRKEEPVTIRVVEHLYRWHNWEIQNATHDFEKVDSDTIAFNVTVPPDSEETLSYTAHYTW